MSFILQACGEEEILGTMNFAVPAFHAYAHNPSCQVNHIVCDISISSTTISILYSPQRCEGFGLSDGEVMECLWSYLRRFSRMTTEMRPAHHNKDILAHAYIMAT